MYYQSTIIVHVIGTQGALDKPESQYKVKYIEDAAETAKRMIIEIGQKHRNIGWSVICGEKETCN